MKVEKERCYRRRVLSRLCGRTSFGLLDALLRLNIFLPGKIFSFWGLVESCENSESHWLSRFSRDNDEKEQNEAVYEGFKLGKDFDADIVVRCTGVKGVVGEDEIRKISEGSIL